jgi:hypothetical protein
MDVSVAGRCEGEALSQIGGVDVFGIEKANLPSLEVELDTIVAQAVHAEDA